MEDSKERALEELTEYYDKKLLEKQGQLEQVQLKSFLRLGEGYFMCQNLKIFDSEFLLADLVISLTHSSMLLYKISIL